MHRVIVPEILWEMRSPSGTGMKTRRAVMKSLKEFFHMIVAAVICFGMKIVSSGECCVVKALTGTGGTVCGTAPDKGKKEVFEKSRNRLFLKNAYDRSQGPGGRLWIREKKRSPSGKKVPEEADKILFYLVPE